MSKGNLLLLLQQINIYLRLYECEKLAENGMTFAQVFLLNEIFTMDSSRISSAELSERTGFTRPSISRTLKELQKNGYIDMERDVKDNRKKYIVLTKKALDAETVVKGYMEGLTNCLVQKIPEHSLAGIETALQTIRDNIQHETLRSHTK